MNISDILCLIQLLIGLTRRLVEAQEYPPPSADFVRHSIVRPVLLHKRTKREILTTRDVGGLHHLEVTLKVPIDGEEYILDLRLNQHLVPDNHVLSYQENDKTVLHKPSKEEMDLCHYGGSVRGRPGSWVAVSTCHGVQGIVFDGERTRYIEPAQGGDVNTDHYIYDHSDLTETHPSRSGNQATSNTRNYGKHSNKTTRYKRHTSRKTLFESYQPNERSLYVELVLVADKKHFEKTHRRNRQSVHREMKTLANIINAVYSQLNIFIVLVGVVIWDDRDEIHFNKDSMSILENFMKYRRTKLVNVIPNDNAHLLSLRSFDYGVVGKAFRGKMCTLESSGGIAHYHTGVAGLLAMTIAHEMGHNLGMEHDVDCECPDEACIMGDTTTERFTPSHWSSCSLKSLAYYFSKGIDNCLRNKPQLSSYKFSTCGNSLVEPGEQCDCGTLAEGAYNPCHACCNPDTCRLRENATCGTGSCCDIQTCSPKSAGTVCRRGKRECDLPEYCSGHSAHCPEDVHKMDTTPCGRDGESAYCVEGGCRSHSDQCRVLWGSTGKSCANQFYRHNTAGDKTGDCGYDPVQGKYKRCENRDIMCGRLHCEHLSESSSNINQLQIGIEFKIHNMAAQTPNRTAPCYAVSIDFGLDVVDFGLVPDGAKCGEGMMCLKQKCVSVAAVRKRAEEILRQRRKKVTPPSPSERVTNLSPPKRVPHPPPPKKVTHPPPPKKVTHPPPPKRVTYPPPPMRVTHPSPPKRVTHPSPPTRVTHPSQPENSRCSSKCSGHGVCNSKGHCQCDPGFSPPFCAQPGPGGAHGSEPATDSTSQETLKLVMYVIFLGIVPAIVLVLLFIYCWHHRQNILQGLKEYKQILLFKSKATDSISKITARQSSVIYSNISTVQSSPIQDTAGLQGCPTYTNTAVVQGSQIYANTAIGQGSPIQANNTVLQGPPIHTSTAITQGSAIYASTAVVCSSSTTRANLGENIISKKTENRPTNPPTFPLKSKSSVKLVTEVPTPNLVNLSREIRPNVQDNSKIRIEPLEKLKTILTNQSQEIRSNVPNLNKRPEEIPPNVQEVNSRIKIGPLVKLKPILNNQSEEIRSNVANLSNRPEEIRHNVRALKAKLESIHQTSD